ncbi:hypothetical protein EB077_09960, partial [bacterium]|nr:hypothetical protein [bacterium]
MEQHGLQYSVEAVLPKDIELRWGELAPLLQKWLNSAFGEYILTDIRRLLEAGDFHAWLVRGNGKAVGVCVTAITEFPQKKILQIVGVAGDKLDEWLELLAEIE